MTRIAPRPGSDAYIVCVGLPPEIVAQVVHALGGRHAVLVVPDGDSAVKLLSPHATADHHTSSTEPETDPPAASDGGRVLAFPQRGPRRGRTPLEKLSASFSAVGGTDATGGPAPLAGAAHTGQIPVVTGAVPTLSGAFPAVPPARTGPITHGPLRLDLAAREVQVQGREVHLSAQEFDLLATLASQPGRVWTFAELTAQVWGTQYLGDADAVTSAIKRLRRRLPRVRGLEVASVRGVGYRLRVPE
ncbi:winged helix-turn-helix domain-containing protein [Myceligenerans salitolerans]|uniref:Winged helix-turn-helix transcriptional regulator n=1 Tax=Myceligenerans salitolerans TaxID=1230528 RepID=A0ABS3I9U7_9MICO|nr:winged helix-turn-helix domain-containing protein [Myceligenerans salitolerans]MBO0609805.1 winged helix-turn-helix transcriptional regulator [Myceligenerans salitolerans]